MCLAPIGPVMVFFLSATFPLEVSQLCSCPGSAKLKTLLDIGLELFRCFGGGEQEHL